MPWIAQRIGAICVVSRCFGREKKNATRGCRVAFVCLASRVACRQFALPDPFILFVGRLDWIRTNDPHHVKVVL